MFGSLKVHIDTWQPDYGPEVAADFDEPDPDVVLDVELTSSQWQPLTPSGPPLTHSLVFVDGVRRIEARIIVQSADGFVYGALGSYAVGSSLVDMRPPRFESARVERVAILGSGMLFPAPIPVHRAAQYNPVSTAGKDNEAILQALENEMRLGEEGLAHQLADNDGVLAVSDGPLHFADQVRGAAVGFIKRVSRFYLPEELLIVLPRLAVGQRTPLFVLRSTRRFARYSWFARIASLRLGDSPFAGIVRMEVSEVVGAESARRLADGTALRLPEFAPSRARDPRAPQNLMPIGALESHLRHLMGDPTLLRRHIEMLVRMEARHG